MNSNKGRDRIKQNKDIAYKGKIGRLREEFCINFIKRKQQAIEKIRYEILEEVAAKGETISCGKGCSSCCMVYVEASLQECEAIVYYLYQNEKVLAFFLDRYSDWKRQLDEYGDINAKCQRILSEKRYSARSPEIEQAFYDSLLMYRMQRIACPFLLDGACTIYEVRPFLCAAHYVTTPPDRCSPLSVTRPKVYKSEVPDELTGVSFYYRNLPNPLFASMPVTVYNILQDGYSYLSGVAGLEGLVLEAMNDPEINISTARRRVSLSE